MVNHPPPGVGQPETAPAEAAGGARVLNVCLPNEAVSDEALHRAVSMVPRKFCASVARVANLREHSGLLLTERQGEVSRLPGLKRSRLAYVVEGKPDIAIRERTNRHATHVASDMGEQVAN